MCIIAYEISSISRLLEAIIALSLTDESYYYYYYYYILFIFTSLFSVFISYFHFIRMKFLHVVYLFIIDY